jgi:hypothetical protein
MKNPCLARKLVEEPLAGTLQAWLGVSCKNELKTAVNRETALPGDRVRWQRHDWQLGLRVQAALGRAEKRQSDNGNQTQQADFEHQSSPQRR